MPDRLETSISPQPIELFDPETGLKLIQYRLQDAHQAFDLVMKSKNHLKRFVGDLYKKYKTFEDFEESIKNPRDPKKLRFGIWNNRGKLVGTINLTPERNSDGLEPNKGEIGYYLGEGYTGKGYAGRAVRLVCDYVFKVRNYILLYAETDPTNFASQKVLTRNGFVHTGRDESNPKEPMEIFELKRQESL